MDSRKITVISTKTQSRKTFMSDAETLADLKRDLDRENIDYTDMAFFEGTARVELKDDGSVLPHDVPYKGQITNELVFMLTNATKKIKSGMDRKEVISAIKSLNLQDTVKERFGKNYTNVSTDNLINLINSKKDTNIPGNTGSATDIKKDEDVVDGGDKQMNEDSCCTNIKAAIETLVDSLNDNGYLSDFDAKVIVSQLNNHVLKNGSMDSSYSSQEIDDMFNFM